MVPRTRIGRLILAVAALIAAQASALDVQLPSRTRWFVTAPNAARFARDATAFLQAASTFSGDLSPDVVNQHIAERLGLGLLREEALESSGVDPTQPWMLFERSGAQYLVVGVKDRTRLAAKLDQWGAGRGLHGRDESHPDHPKGAVMVTFSREEGTRPAAGYLIADDQAIILVQPSGRRARLLDAYRALDNAAPVRSGVDGTLLVWMGHETALRDGWMAVTARQDGIDIAGEARRIDAGFVARSGQADWIRALTGSEGGPGDAPARIRVEAGPKTALQVVNAFAPLFNASLTDEGRKSWLNSLAALAPGPLEIVASAVDISAVQSQGGRDVQRDVLRLMHPSVIFSNRPAAAVAACLKTASPALCQPETEAGMVRATCSSPALTVGRTGQSLFVGWTGSSGHPALLRHPGGRELSCPRGRPIGSARLNLAVIGRALDGVSVLSALSNPSLAGMLALSVAYGPLLRASRPAIGLACLEPSGRVTFQGRWRFRAGSVQGLRSGD